MSDAPERIWAWKWSIPSAMGQWSETDPRPYIGQDAARGCFEAVSADLHAATLARAERAEAERDQFRQVAAHETDCARAAAEEIKRLQALLAEAVDA